MTLCAMHVPLPERTDIKLTKFAQQPDTLVGSAYNIVHDQLDYRKKCAGWVSKNLSDDRMAHHMGLPDVH